MSKIKEIIFNGKENQLNIENTNWLLKSAIKNPNCVIVSSSGIHSNYIIETYNKLIKKEPIIKQFYWYIFGRKRPMFITLGYTKFNDLKDIPVLFDNSCLI